MKSLIAALVLSSCSAIGAENVYWLEQGADSGGVLRALGPVEGARKLAVPASGRHLLVLTNQGRIAAWGDNADGQLGTGDFESHRSFAGVSGLTGVTAIGAGTAYSVALKGDGTVWTAGWGRSSFEPVAGLWNVLRIAAGDDFVLALRSDGTVWSFGKARLPEQVSGLWEAAAVAAKGGIRYAGDTSGRVWRWAEDGTLQSLDSHDREAAAARRMWSDVPVVTEWLDRPVHVDGNELRLGNRTFPFDGMLLELEAGWTVAMLTRDAPASTADSSADSPSTATAAPRKISSAGSSLITGRLLSSSLLITAYDTHSLYVTGAGTACGFGENSEGQLGDATAADRSTPVPAAFLSSLVSISTSQYHSAAVKNDGTLYTWGYNQAGRLGDGTTVDRVTPYPVSGFTGAVAVATGTAHTVVLKNDGTVWTFGSNSFGELGDGSFTARNSPVQVIGLSGVTAVSAGTNFSLALKSDGTVWGWGRNTYGGLGDGTTTTRSSPVQAVGLNGVTAIASATFHSVVLKNDGTVWGFGYNGYGALGDGSTTNRSSAVRAGTLTGVTSIGTGEYHSIAVRGDGTVFAFGINTSGQLGDGTITNRLTPVQVSGLTGVVRAVGGTLHSIAAKSDGSIWAWGDNANRQLGNGTTTDTTVPVAVSACAADPSPSSGPAPSPSMRAISARHTHSLAVRPDGTAAGFGENSEGEIGDATTTDRNTPSAIAGLTGVVNVSAGYYHGAGALSGGTARSWGYNQAGRLGDGTTTARISPVAVAGLTGVTAMSAGTDHTLALKSDGTVWAFGANGFGQLGDGSNTARANAVQVIGLTNVTAIAAGDHFSMALKSDGTVWAWGQNTYGVLGDGAGPNKTSPVQVRQMTGAVAIAAGSYHALILRNDGTVWGVGYNGYGALGDGSTATRYHITRMNRLTDVKAIGAGENHSLAVKSDGTVWTSGQNNSGQLGDGSVTNRALPVQAASGLTGVVAVTGGSDHSLALKSDGCIWAWGANTVGQFGVPAPANSTVPTQGPCNFGVSSPSGPPIISQLTPGSVNVGSAAFNLDVTGVNFTNQSVVRWNGVARTTTYLNATTLRAQIGAADVASAGSVPVTVFDPVNGTSAAVSFTIVGSVVGQPSNPSPADNTTGAATTTSVSWTAAANATTYDVHFGTSNPPSFVATLAGTTYNPGPLSLNTTYYWYVIARNGGPSNASPVWKFTTFNPTGGLRFVPVVPCRLADTRTGSGFSGNFGAPTLNAGVTREMTIPAGPCGIPSSAKAYSFNVTVVPSEPLSYLTMWPTGQAQPLVSTLNSFHGGIVANAAIVPAGTNGAVSIFVTNRTDVILDINGYFDDNLGVTAYSFYSVDPCRVADTRTGSGFSGLYGAPTPAANETRSFPLAGRCSLPAAAAYSLNVTVVPPAPLSFLTIFPTGSTRPLVSTLNSFDGAIVANAAIVPAASNGAVSTFVTHVADQILDVNGYFGTPGGANELRFNPITPCRVADTRIAGQGAPIMNASTQKDFPVAGVCGVPSDAKAYSLNVTVVPTGGLSFLTLWPAGKTRPLVSTLNSFLGRVVANAAIAPAGTNGNVSVFVTDQTHVILDINGYFR